MSDSSCAPPTDPPAGLGRAAEESPRRAIEAVVLGALPAEYRESLRMAFAGLRLTEADSAVAPEVMLVWRADVERVLSVLGAHGSVRWVHTKFAGVPPALLAYVRARGILLTNGSGAFGWAIAEYVAGVLLAQYKRLATLREAQERRAWLPDARIDQLAGKRVLIVGMGDLGQSISRVLAVFEARVSGVSRSGAAVGGVERVAAFGAFRDLLPEADVLVLAAPLTGETRGMIGAAELAAMPRGSYVVNVARGPLLQTEALIEAVRSGHLAGAALDVFDEEPLAADSPLWTTPGVLISPHCADHTPGAPERGFAILEENLGRYVRGEPLRNVVDRTLGY